MTCLKLGLTDSSPVIFLEKLNIGNFDCNQANGMNM